jgi:hypothetical protein
MRRTRPFPSSLLIFASLLLFLSVQGAALAQSGRRAPKGSGTATPAPTPTQTEQTPPVQAKAPAQPQISLLVVSDISQTLYLAIPFPERVQTWVAKRLRDSSALAVMEGERANRSEAIKRAKASTDTFVIFLRVDESNATLIARPGRPNVGGISIGYFIIAPVTGKTQSSGVVYVNERSTSIGIGRGRSVPLCFPGVRGNDLLLLEASLEVASRIISALDVPAPPLCP